MCSNILAPQVMAIKAVKMLDMKFHITLKLNDLPTSDVVGILGIGVSLGGCQAEPLERLRIVPWHPLAFIIQEAKVILGVTVPLGR